MTPQILPAILAADAAELQERLLFPGFWQPDMVAHVDILDGSMFGATCFCDPRAVATPSAPSGRGLLVPSIELHCMVQNPLPIIKEWKSLVPSTIRAIVHIEMYRPIDPVLHHIHELGLENGVALCPETLVDRLGLLLETPDRVLMMGIPPGAAGQSFLGEPILSKVRRLRTLHPQLTIAMDGGVTTELANSMYNAGANALVANTAIWHNTHPKQAYEIFTHSAMLHEGSAI
jgi:ribulose-phosphate 3-epimerase